MKNKLKARLNCELRSVRVSSTLKANIMAEAYRSRREQEPFRSPLGFLAIAAAVMVVIGLTAGFLNLRTERIDRRSAVLSRDNEGWVWVSGTDRLYHDQKPCGDMTEAVRMELERAIAEGRSPCPRCIDETGAVLPLPGMTDAPAPEDAGDDSAEVPYNGQSVEIYDSAESPDLWDAWYTQEDAYYHESESCIGRADAERCIAAMARYGLGKHPCPQCAKSVWATRGGVYCHQARNCTGMQNAQQWTLDEAQAMGKQLCPVCMDDLPVWVDQSDAYYHIYLHGEGMERARELAENQAHEQGKEACPVCFADVWTSETDAFYHDSEECPGMTDVLPMYRGHAAAAGKQPCPQCMEAEAAENAEKSLYYATKNGVYYHALRDCSDMRDAELHSETMLIQDGKRPCPICVNGQAQWLDNLSEQLVSLEAAVRGDWLVVSMEYEPQVEWIPSDRSQPVNTDSAEARQMLEDAGQSMTQAQQEDLCKLLAEGEISGFRCLKFGIGYSVAFESAWPQSAQDGVYLGGGIGDTQRRYLVSPLGQEIPGELPLYLYATVIDWALDSEGNWTIATENAELSVKEMDPEGGTALLQVGPRLTSELSQVVFTPDVVRRDAPGIRMETTEAGDALTLLDVGDAILAMIDIEDCGDVEQNLLRSEEISAAVQFFSGQEPVSVYRGTSYNGRAVRSAFLMEGGYSIETLEALYPVADDVIYYATHNGRYYHVHSDCSGMLGAEKMTQADAIGAGKQPCPQCISTNGSFTSSS